MNRTYRHSIYGSRKTTNAALEQCCKKMNDIIRSVTGMMYTVMNTVDAYFPETLVMNQIIGQMRSLARLPPKLFVRVTWRQRYPNVYFDDRNVLHRLQIKGIYLEFGGDYCDDPLFKDALGVTLITESKLGRDIPDSGPAKAQPRAAPAKAKQITATATTEQKYSLSTRTPPMSPPKPPASPQKLTPPEDTQPT